MGRTIPAIVTPEVLQWARNLDSISVDEIARKIKVTEEKINSWESGTAHPTLAQAKKLAKQYRVPFAFFYLPDTPKKIKRLDKIDYRTFGNIGVSDMSRELRWFMRDIEERRDLISDLHKELGVVTATANYAATIKTPAVELANYIRNSLELTEEIQKKFRKPENIMAYCVSKLEEKNFLIFQGTKIEPAEMRGLSLAYDTFPIIALNRKDEMSARVFTLFHELVHIFTKTSGICNDITQNGNQMDENEVELYCNNVAGLALVPDILLKNNKNITMLQGEGVSDECIRAVARDFAVSREVILHRLMEINIISRSEYYTTLAQYKEEYLQYQKQKKGGRIPPALDKGSQVGKLYVKTIMMAYHAEKLTPREVSGCLLGLKIQHFGAIEKWGV